MRRLAQLPPPLPLQTDDRKASVSFCEVFSISVSSSFLVTAPPQAALGSADQFSAAASSGCACERARLSRPLVIKAFFFLFSVALWEKGEVIPGGW